MLIFDEKLLDRGFAHTKIRQRRYAPGWLTHLVTGTESGKVTSCLSTLANVAFLSAPLKGVVANWGASAKDMTGEMAAHDHLIDQNSQSPPIDSHSMTVAFDDLGRNVFCERQQRHEQLIN